jgi:anti-sigma regulatory factor (Ser/Thr protein kinase)
LVLSELVTNAVKYGTEHGQDVLRIVIEAEGESLRVEIEQPRPATDLKPVEPRLEANDFGGLGLYIVDELADDWGTEAGPPGTVWFEFLAKNRTQGPDHPWA